MCTAARSLCYGSCQSISVNIRRGEKTRVVAAGALDVAFFVREMIQSYPKMHASLLEQLRDTFTQLQSARVCTTVLWILAEYSREVSDVTAAIDTILGSLGPTPFSKDAGGALSLRLRRR